MELQYKAIESAVKSLDEGRRTLRSWISREVVDRQNDLIPAAGINLDSYRANPVVLWSHDQRFPPIGKSTDLAAVPGEGLDAQTEFATTPFASEVWDLYRGGFLSAFSIGFKALAPPDPPDGDRRHYVLPSIELLEYSAVAVPANPMALVKAVEAGSDIAEVLLKRLYPEERDACDAARLADYQRRLTGSLEWLRNLKRHHDNMGTQLPFDLAELASEVDPLLAELFAKQIPAEPAQPTDLAPEPTPDGEAIFARLAELHGTLLDLRQSQARDRAQQKALIEAAVEREMTRRRRMAIGGVIHR